MAEGAEIWFVRHAESEANASGVWQGQSESGLTPRGLQQVEALLGRLAGVDFDAIVSSPLGRARETAAALGEPSIDPGFLEIDLGSWEGKSWRELAATDLSDLEALRRGANIRFGGVGESTGELRDRVLEAIERVFGRLATGGRAIVVTHGGVLDVLVERAFGRIGGRRLAGFPANTSITRLVRRFGQDRLLAYNDTAHLGSRPQVVVEAVEAGHPVMAIIRHARTAANKDGRWQGHSDGGLDSYGHGQAAALAAGYPALDRVVTSPLGRARQTALQLHPEPEVLDDLAELGFGKWEGLTADEIRQGWPDLFESIFERGNDLARGETGETWNELASRVRNGIESIKPGPGQVTGVVTHGAAIRAYLSSLVGGDWRRAHAWDTPLNTSLTHVILYDEGPFVVDYGTAGHLQGMGW
ncbi:MAG TPA: histidine phosphatase family protein [Acidimicrobiia bacterium]|nr:histidine phosphatase family protein [Acidimicrobiia bacterium]